MRKLLLVTLTLTIFCTLASAWDTYPTNLQPTGTLPVVYINVYDEASGDYDNELLDINLLHKDYFQGEYWLDINGCQWMIDMGLESVGSAEEPLPLQVKGRGNYTLKKFNKKPFKMKLEKKQDLLGLTPEKNKHYCLLAHADDDKGFMRNFTGFNLGRRIGLQWSPDQQPVELVFNGDYRGLYFLTESIRVGEGRIEIEELDDLAEDPALISGGYIVELDNNAEENFIRLQEQWYVPDTRFGVGNLDISWEAPEEYSEIQERFVTDQFTAMNDLVGECSDDLWSYMDLDDAARYYIVMELASHKEAFRGSTYLSRDRGEGQKWRFTAPWDFGHAFASGETNFIYDDPNRWWHHYWLASICANQKFQDKVKETWKWFMSNRFNGIYEEMETYASVITAAAAQDWQRWKNVPKPSYPDSRDLCNNTNMAKKLSYNKSQMANKVNWLIGQWGSYSTANPAEEPARDLTPAAPLPDYAMADPTEPTDPEDPTDPTDPTGPEDPTGVASVKGNSAKAVYYTMQGIKVENPLPGNCYIRVINGRARRILLP